MALVRNGPFTLAPDHGPLANDTTASHRLRSTGNAVTITTIYSVDPGSPAVFEEGGQKQETVTRAGDVVEAVTRTISHKLRLVWRASDVGPAAIAVSAKITDDTGFSLARMAVPFYAEAGDSAGLGRGSLAKADPQERPPKKTERSRSMDSLS